VRSHDAGRQDPASLQQPRHHSRRSRRLVRFRAGIFPLQGRRPSASPKDGGFPFPQGKYYTGVGYKNVGDIAREIVEEHLDLCLDAGINHEGINAEVAKGQWEFQIFGKGSKNAADQVWVARYLLMRLCEKYGVDVNFHCKPLGVDVDWNGSGMHSNFSTKHMREVGGKEYFEKPSWLPSTNTRTSTSPCTARTTTCASPVCTKRSPSTSSTTVSPTAAPPSASRTAS
jgi:hypothetical protein